MPRNNFPAYLFDPKTETTTSFKRRWTKCKKGGNYKIKPKRCTITRHLPKPLPHRMPSHQSWIIKYPWASG